MHLKALLITAFSLFLALPSSAMASPERGAQKLQSTVNQSTTAWSPVKASKRATNSWITSLKRNDCKGISRVTAGKCMDRKCYTSCQTGKCRGIARGDYTSCSGDGVCKGVARVIDTLGECYDAYDRKKRKQGNKFDRRVEDRKLRQCDAKARSDAKSYCSGPNIRLCRAWVTGDSSYCKSGDRDCKGVVKKDKSYCESANCKAIARGDGSYCR